MRENSILTNQGDDICRRSQRDQVQMFFQRPARLVNFLVDSLSQFIRNADTGQLACGVVIVSLFGIEDGHGFG